MNSNRELNYRWILSYLVAANILTISLSLYEVPDLVDKLSFALTLSSLLLAILAIFNSIISANRQSDQLSRILETNNEMKSASANIKESAYDISKLISDIPSHFTTMGKKIDALQNEYVSAKVDITPKKPDSNPIIENFDKVKFMEILSHLHFKAMGILYLFSKSQRKGKNIPFEHFSKFNLSTPEYASGVLISLKALELLDFKIHEQAIIPIKCNEIISEEINEDLDIIISVVDEPNKTFLTNTVSSIDKLFN